jgi:selenocysteine lyase/cysteine desulfurase
LALEAIDRYFGIEFGCAVLTHGTAMGLAQVLGGVRLSPGQEILTSHNEHPATMDTLRFRAERDGTPYRQVRLFNDSRTATASEIVQNVASALRPSTRVLALAWVYSSDGVKLPLEKIGRLVDTENARRTRLEDQLLFVVDGVHGFGVEDAMFADLKCDFFISGCHKWIFGPRGTGIVAARREAWTQVVPMVSPLSSASTIQPAFIHIPGGVVAYEHRWALGAAFDFHTDVLVKKDVQARVRELSAYFKGGLSKIPSVTLVTPTSPELSSGVVCFDIAGRSVSEVLAHLKTQKVIASSSAWDYTAGRSHVRFSISVLNSLDDIDAALLALAAVPDPGDP